MEQDVQDEVVETIYLIGDTETAGLGDSKKTCELALMQIDPVTLEPLQRWQSLIDPEIPIQEGAYNIHGISNEMVADEPTMDEFIEHRLGGKFKQDIVLICHNVSFDLPLIQPIGNIVRTVCTLQLSRNLIKDSSNHKLQTLREYFNIPENQAHRAMADVEVTHALLRELIRLSGRTLENLAATREQAVLVMPFGKHKGQLIMSLPKSYLTFMLGLELDEGIRTAMKKAMKLK